MLNKKDLMFGIVFLSLMIALMFVIDLSFIPSVSAQYDWHTYGNLPQNFNEQLASAHGRFNVNVVSSNISKGYVNEGNVSMNFQPIVTNFHFGNFTDEYLVFPIDNYLEVYNKNLVLVQEISTGGLPISQIDTMDFNQDGNYEIVGAFSVNATTFAFKVFSLNSSLAFNNSLIQYFNYMSGGNGGVVGIKHTGNTAYFLYTTNTTGLFQYNFVKINDTNLTTVPLAYKSPNIFRDLPARQDVNGDGNQEYVVYSTNQVLLFGEDGSTLMNYSVPVVYGGEYIQNVKLLKADATSVWKIAVMEYIRGSGGSSLPSHIVALRPDGTTYWAIDLPRTQSTSSVYGTLATADDYNGDGYNDLYAVTIENYYNGFSFVNYVRAFVISGYDGSILISKDFGLTLGFPSYSGSINSLTIANLNPDNYMDFIYSNGAGSILMYDIKNDISYYNRTSGDFISSCIPADLSVSGFQDVICSGSTRTLLFQTTYQNQNPTINSVVYSPSTTIQTNVLLNMNVNSVDNESDLVYYSYSCFDGDNWTANTLSSSGSCIYNTVGIFNASVRVQDSYHQSNYSYFSQSINVLAGGINPCNNNGICEVGIGENNGNCPNDCSVTNSSQNQQDTGTGGSAIPTQLVDPANINQGLLPEIYFGTLGFFSNTLQPIIILVFMIFFVMIILAIAFIIRSIGKKVSDLA